MIFKRQPVFVGNHTTAARYIKLNHRTPSTLHWVRSGTTFLNESQRRQRQASWLVRPCCKLTWCVGGQRGSAYGCLVECKQQQRLKECHNSFHITLPDRRERERAYVYVCIYVTEIPSHSYILGSHFSLRSIVKKNVFGPSRSRHVVVKVKIGVNKMFCWVT